ncbi:MAG: ubiquinone/menaquinone biosynthesis methyltransferase [Nitrososphaerales archaeon]
MKQFDIAESQVEREGPANFNAGRADKKVNYVIRLFSDGPEEYDFLLKILSLGRDNYWRESLIREAAVGHGSLVLDIACGTGLVTYQFADKGVRVVGIDVTKEMLRRATHLAPYAICDVDFIQARAENLPLRSDVFDASTISLAMRNVSSQTETLDEMRRCTKKGCRVISLDFAKPRSSLFKPFYNFYIFKLLPAMGFLISRHWNTIFLYLANSIERAREPEQITWTMQKVGLAKASIRRMTHGVTALVSGTR